MITSLWELISYSLASLNVQIIWSYQNAARIAKPYCVVDYTTVTMPGHEYYGPPDDNGMAINSGWRRATAEIQFYCAQDSYALASKAAALLATSASLDKQWELDVSIGQRLMLQRLPALLNESQFEDRAIYQFEFFYTENTPDDVGLIEVVVVDGTYTGGLTEDVTCHEVIMISDRTNWDNYTTGWDTGITLWDNANGQ
jgi:hypothetical protein